MDEGVNEHGNYAKEMEAENSMSNLSSFARRTGEEWDDFIDIVYEASHPRSPVHGSENPEDIKGLPSDPHEPQTLPVSSVSPQEQEEPDKGSIVQEFLEDVRWQHDSLLGKMSRLREVLARHLGDSDEREDVQKKTFAKWINSQLAKGNHPLVTDLFYDLRDGTRLLGLLEVLTGSTYKREKGKMRVHHLNNVSRGLNILEQHNVKLVNISNDDIVDGSAKLTLGLVWSIILHWQVQGVLKDVMADLQQTNLEKTLLAWCRQTTKGYHGVDVRNFTTSWTDGLAFNALIHRHRPDLFDWPTVAKKLPFARLEQAFRLANKEFGIERLLDPEDVNTQVPDKKSMMMYIMCLFQALPKASFTMESLDVSIQSDSSFSLEASGGDEKNRPLSTVSIGLGGYQRTLEEVLTWLLGAEDRLAAMPPIAEEPEEVKQQFHQLEDLMLELTAKQGGIGDVLGEGTRLLKEGVMGEEEEEEVRVQMKLLNTRWEDLRVKAMDRQTQLHDCLMQLQQSQLENLKSWLTATEDRISKMSEVGPTTEDLKAQVVAHHKLQQDLEGEQANINSLSNMVVVVDEGNSDAAYSNLEDELNALGERWAHICRWAEQRWTTLQVLTVHWEQLEREMEKLGKWLDENEAQLKQMESNPSTDQEHLLRQAGTLQVLQSEMDIQQRRFALLQEESSKVLSNLPKDSPAQTKIPETLENLQDRWDCLVAIIEAQNQRLAASGIDIKRTDFPSETDGSVVSSSTSTITHEGATMITKVITTKTTTTKHVEEGSFKRQKLEGESYEEFNVALNQLGGWMDTVQERLQPKQTDDLSYEQLVQLCQHLQDEVQTQQEEYNKVMSLGQSAISETATIGECSSESESKVTDFAARWQALSEMMANLQSRIEFMAERKKLTAELSAMEIHYQGFQRWFDNVRTVSENEPNAITSQVEQCKTKIAGMKSHEQRLNEMNQTVSNLSSKWPIEAAAIVHSGKEFIEKWEALLLKFVDWGNALSSELEKQPPQSYLEALTALKRWLTNVEAAVTTEPLVISKLPVLSDQLQNYKELLKTVEVEESSLAYINRTGNELLSRSEVNIRLKGDLVELNKRWESAVAALKSRVENVEKAIEMLGQYRDEVSGLKSWLAEVDVFLHAEDAALGDIETLEAQLEQSNALQDDISTLETNVNNIKTTSGHIIQETNDEELRNEVSQQVKDLSDRWDVVLDLARRQNKSLKDALAKSQKVHEDISKLNMWLDKLELEFPPVKPIETSSELSSVIGVISKLREDIANHTDTFRSVNEIGNEMLQYENVTSHDDMARQFTLLNGRWTDIISQIDRRHKTLTKATEQYAQFQVLCEEETSWLDQLEQKLEKSSKSAADAEEISEALDDLEIFLHGHHEERLQKVQELAEQLVQEGVMTFAVQNSTHDLTSRFNSLNAQANEQRTTLEGGVQEAQAWEREYISVLEWLTHTDVVITQAVADPSTHLEGTDEVLKELTRQQEVLAKMEAQVQVYQSSGKLEAAQRLEDQVVHLKKKYEEVQGKLQQLNSAPSDFDVRLKTMDAQLHDISQNVQLVSLTAGNPTAIQDQLNLCLQLYRTLSEVKGEVESVIATGRKIVKENQTSNPEGLTQQLDQLKALYNELGKAVTEQRGILEQSLRQSKKILKDGQHLEDWLSTTEHELDTREATVPLRSVQHELHFAQHALEDLGRKKPLLSGLQESYVTLTSLCGSEEQLLPLREHIDDVALTWERVYTRLCNRLQSMESEQDEKKDEMEKFIVGLGEVKGWLEVTENKLSNLTKYPAEERANIIKKVSQEVQDYKGQIESIRDTSVELISHGELFESRVQPELVTINQRWEHIFKTVTISDEKDTGFGEKGHITEEAHDLSIDQEKQSEEKMHESFLEVQHLKADELLKEKVKENECTLTEQLSELCGESTDVTNESVSRQMEVCSVSQSKEELKPKPMSSELKTAEASDSEIITVPTLSLQLQEVGETVIADEGKWKGVKTKAEKQATDWDSSSASSRHGSTSEGSVDFGPEIRGTTSGDFDDVFIARLSKESLATGRESNVSEADKGITYTTDITRFSSASFTSTDTDKAEAFAQEVQMDAFEPVEMRVLEATEDSSSDDESCDDLHEPSKVRISAATLYEKAVTQVLEGRTSRPVSYDDILESASVGDEDTCPSHDDSTKETETDKKDIPAQEVLFQDVPHDSIFGSFSKGRLVEGIKHSGFTKSACAEDVQQGVQLKTVEMPSVKEAQTEDLQHGHPSTFQQFMLTMLEKEESHEAKLAIDHKTTTPVLKVSDLDTNNEEKVGYTIDTRQGTETTHMESHFGETDKESRVSESHEAVKTSEKSEAEETGDKDKLTASSKEMYLLPESDHLTSDTRLSMVSFTSTDTDKAEAFALEVQMDELEIQTSSKIDTTDSSSDEDSCDDQEEPSKVRISAATLYEKAVSQVLEGRTSRPDSLDLYKEYIVDVDRVDKKLEEKSQMEDLTIGSSSSPGKEEDKSNLKDSHIPSKDSGVFERVQETSTAEAMTVAQICGPQEEGAHRDMIDISDVKTSLKHEPSEKIVVQEVEKTYTLVKEIDDLNTEQVTEVVTTSEALGVRRRSSISSSSSDSSSSGSSFEMVENEPEPDLDAQLSASENTEPNLKNASKERISVESEPMDHEKESSSESEVESQTADDESNDEREISLEVKLERHVSIDSSVSTLSEAETVIHVPIGGTTSKPEESSVTPVENVESVAQHASKETHGGEPPALVRSVSQEFIVVQVSKNDDMNIPEASMTDQKSYSAVDAEDQSLHDSSSCNVTPALEESTGTKLPQTHHINVSSEKVVTHVDKPLNTNVEKISELSREITLSKLDTPLTDKKPADKSAGNLPTELNISVVNEQQESMITEKSHCISGAIVLDSSIENQEEQEVTMTITDTLTEGSKETLTLSSCDEIDSDYPLELVNREVSESDIGKHISPTLSSSSFSSENIKKEFSDEGGKILPAQEVEKACISDFLAKGQDDISSGEDDNGDEFVVVESTTHLERMVIESAEASQKKDMAKTVKSPASDSSDSDDSTKATDGSIDMVESLGSEEISSSMEVLHASSEVLNSQSPCEGVAAETQRAQSAPKYEASARKADERAENQRGSVRFSRISTYTDASEGEVIFSETEGEEPPYDDTTDDDLSFEEEALKVMAEKQEAETAVLDMKVGTHKEVKQKDSSLPSTSKVVTHVMTKTTITTTSTSSSSSSQVPRPDEDQVDIYLREVSSMSDRITALKYKTKDIPHFNEAKEKVEGLEHEVALLEPDVATVISRGDTLTLTTHMVDVPRANSIRLAVNDLRQQWSTLKADTEHLKNETDLVNQEIENYPERVDVLITWLNEVTKRLDIVNNDESQLEALEREMASKKEEIDKINETGERMKKYQYAQLQPIITLINTRWTELTMQFRQYRKVPHETKTIVPGSKDSTVLEPSKVPDYVASVNRLREAISAISRQLNAPLMNGREFDNLNAQEEELKVIKQGLDTLKPRVDSTETEREAVMSSATPSEADQVRRVVDKLRQEWAQVNRGYTEHHARWLHASESIRALHKMTEDFSVWLSSIEEKVQITANQPLHEAKITQKDLEKQVTLKHRPSQNLQTKCKEITEEMNVDDGRRLQDHVDNLMKRWRSLLLDLAARRERIATEETGKDTSTDYEDLVTWLDQVQGLVDAPVNVTDEASLSAHITMVQNHVIECGGKQVLLKRLKEGKSKGVTPAQIATLDTNMTKIANLLPEYKSNLDTKQGVIKTLGDNVEDLYKWTEEMRVRVALHNLTQDEIKQMRATLREKTAWYESLDSTYWVLAQDAESKGLTVSVDLKNRMNSIESRLKALQAQLAESSAAGASTSFAMAAPVEEQENKKKVIVEAEVEAVKEDDMASSMSSSVTSSVTTVIHNVKMEESVLSTEGDMRPPSPLVCPPKHSPDSSPAVVLASLDKSILQIRDWLTLVEQMVKQQTAVVGDSDDIRTLIEKQKSVLRELESKKPQLDELVASADSLKDEDSRTQLHQKVSKLREHWDETNSSVLQRKTQLDVMMADTHKFYTKRVEVDTWLMRLEARMERMAPVAHTADILDQQIREQKGIHAELHQYKHQMELFNQMTQRLITIYQHDDTRKIKKITETINMRYSNLSSSIIARGKVLHSAMNSLHNFDKALDKFRAWLSETESLADQLDMEVDKLGPGRRDMQPRRPSIHLKDLQSEIESHKDVLASLNATGQKLLGTLDNQDEAVMLQRRLEEMNQRWNNLKHKSMAIRNRLEGNAENWNSLLLSLRELIEWVIRKDTELNALGPLVGDISSLSKYEEDLSVFRRVLDEKQPVIESNLKSGRQLIASEPPLSDTSDSEAGRDLDGDNRYRGEETARDLTRSVRREVAKLSEKWAALRERAGATASQANLANKKLGVLQKTVEEVGGRLEDAEKTVAAWGTVPQDPNLADQHVHNVKKFREGLADLQRGVDDVNDQAARFSAHNVPLTPANSARLHDLNNRWKTLETTVNDRWRQLAGRSREVTPMTPAQLASSVAPPWERATASNKVPYYINHDRESTHWDHPDMMELLDSMAQYNHIKFSAYRTAMKLRTLQKKLALEYAKLQTATGIFDEHGLRGQNDRLIDVNDMVVVLSALYASIASDHPEINTTLAMDLCLNWLLNVYDSQRTGQMRVLSFKVGLVCLCTGHLEEKYRYMFRLIADLNRLVDQRKLGLLLHDCVQVPRQLGEVAAFGGSNIEPSVRSCFTKAGKDRETIEAVHFLSWVQQEPQSLVWLAVLHRVAASENVHHQVKCNICKAYPVVGLRYRCLKCLSFDMCQQCFFGGRSNKSHKVTHPMHEYCTATTTGEDMKDFTKALKNKFKSKRSLQKHAKKGYLPVQTVLEGDALESPAPSPQHNVSSQDMHTRLEMYASRLAEVELRTNSNSTPDSEDEHGLIAQYCQSLSSSDAPLPVPRSPLQIMAAVDAEQKEELEAMIRDLEEENKVLQAEYDRLKAQKPLGSPPEDFGPQGRSETDMIAEAKLLREHKGRLEARMSILEEHNRQLEAQLHRLRQLLEEPSGASSPNKSGTLQTKSVTASQLAMDSPAKVNGHSTAQGGSGGPYEGLEQMSEYVRPPPPPLGSMSHVGNLFSRAGDLGKAVGTLVATMTDEGEKDSRSSHHSTEDSE